MHMGSMSITSNSSGHLLELIYGSLKDAKITPRALLESMPLTNPGVPTIAGRSAELSSSIATFFFVNAFLAFFDVYFPEFVLIFDK